eukprot:CAMPEP_0206314818 /NCGR_PEP_ID=MMETSP0106_2-20121207/15218_1 /ASSEMBLY_ACC=CAM_ASM_000206 /TAXON_ID=81532 /ORGANISM="Acanthoeca-like sp., Strain 10tr" /LENGTH=338 /DNA_ID=CAMNT_0053746195 /DNA_START=73 /DNA_END=1088 /DNA_ORIENTATION=+
MLSESKVPDYSEFTVNYKGFMHCDSKVKAPDEITIEGLHQVFTSKKLMKQAQSDNPLAGRGFKKPVTFSVDREEIRLTQSADGAGADSDLYNTQVSKIVLAKDIDNNVYIIVRRAKQEGKYAAIVLAASRRMARYCLTIVALNRIVQHFVTVTADNGKVSLHGHKNQYNSMIDLIDHYQRFDITSDGIGASSPSDSSVPSCPRGSTPIIFTCPSFSLNRGVLHPRRAAAGGCAQPRPPPAGESIDGQQLDLKDQRRFRGDDATRTRITVAVVRLHRQHSLLADFHRHDPHVPTLDDLADADGEVERSPALHRRVEHAAIGELPGVVHRELIFCTWRRT